MENCPVFVFESLFMNQKEAKIPLHKKFMNKVGYVQECFLSGFEEVFRRGSYFVQT